MMCIIVNKYGNVLQINPELRGTFQKNPLVVFKRNRSLQEIIGGHTIKNEKPFYVTNKSLTLVHFEVTNHSNYTLYFTIFIIYLLKCALCKVHYAGKAESAFNIRLNNHRKDANHSKSIPVDFHFRKSVHSFKLHAKFKSIEKLSTIHVTNNYTLKFRLKCHEDFTIKKLETLIPKELS